MQLTELLLHMNIWRCSMQLMQAVFKKAPSSASSSHGASTPTGVSHDWSSIKPEDQTLIHQVIPIAHLSCYKILCTAHMSSDCAPAAAAVDSACCKIWLLSTERQCGEIMASVTVHCPHTAAVWAAGQGCNLFSTLVTIYAFVS